MSINQVEFFRYSAHLRDTLVKILGNTDDADIVHQGMRLQSQYGECFASARFLGFQVAQARYLRANDYIPTEDPQQKERIKLNGRMIVLRLMKRLKEQHFIRTKRRIRPDKTQGTNVIDFTALWEYIKPILKALSQMTHGQSRSFLTRDRWGTKWLFIMPGKIAAMVNLAMPPPLKNIVAQRFKNGHIQGAS